LIPLPSYTFQSGDHGVHTFSMTLKTAGLQNVTVSDTVANVSQSTSISVSPGPLFTFLVQTAGSNVAGQARTIVITALDQFQNVEKGFTALVPFTSTDPQAILPADYQFQSSDQGIHTFTGAIVLKTAGTQTLT